MDTQQLKKEIDSVEACVDEAKNAMQSAGNVPQPLRESIDNLHQQARTAKKDGTGNDDALRGTVMQLEQAADRAMQACRTAGNVDPKLQQAVQKAHDQLSRLKKQVEADSHA
jgi:chromosome segregation ATPase